MKRFGALIEATAESWLSLDDYYLLACSIEQTIGTLLKYSHLVTRVDAEVDPRQPIDTHILDPPPGLVPSSQALALIPFS